MTPNRDTFYHQLIGILLLILLFCAPTQAQPGYQGKRLMYKTDLVSPVLGQGVNFSAEYVIFRRLVGGLDFALKGKTYPQPLGDFQAIYGELPTSRARIRDIQVGFNLQYFLNSALPAPKGSYIFGRYAVGRANIYGNDFVSADSTLIGYKIDQIPSNQIDAGLGYQDVLWGFLIINFNLGVSAGALYIDRGTTTATPDQILLARTLANKHGPNLLSITPRRNQVGGIGISAQIKVGILLK